MKDNELITYMLSDGTKVEVSQGVNKDYIFTLVFPEGGGDSFVWNREEKPDKNPGAEPTQINSRMHEALHEFWRRQG